MAAEPVRYTVVESRLGRLLVAGTGRGVCLIAFARTPEEIQRRLRAELPFAEWVRDDSGLHDWGRALARYVDGEATQVRIPLDVRGSRFQRRVWDALRRIPRGQTRSYSDVARSIGQPGAARAVARACAANPLPVLVPCHRVVAADGSLGGYAFGVRRKRALLAAEGETPAAQNSVTMGAVRT